MFMKDIKVYKETIYQLNIMDTQKISKYITELQEFINKDENKNLKDTNFELYKYRVESTFTEFNDKYPTIVKKILQGDNLDYLDKMLTAMDQIKKNNVTKDEVEKNLGEELAQEFLYPVVNKIK